MCINAVVCGLCRFFVLYIECIQMQVWWWSMVTSASH